MWLLKLVYWGWSSVVIRGPESPIIFPCKSVSGPGKSKVASFLLIDVLDSRKYCKRYTTILVPFVLSEQTSHATAAKRGGWVMPRP